MEKVPCSGVLWVLEQIRLSRAATALQLRDGLVRIKQHTRARLPGPQVEALMRQFEDDIKKVCEPIAADKLLKISESRADATTNPGIYKAQVELVPGGRIAADVGTASTAESTSAGEVSSTKSRS